MINNPEKKWYIYRMDSFESFRLPIKYDTVAGSVVVFERSVLVLFLAGRLEYRLPKGHIEPGETPLQAAIRETGEESGYKKLIVQADLGKQTVEFDLYNKHVVRTEYYFLMHIKDREERKKVKDKFKPVWMPWNVALEKVTFEGEKEWLRRARAFLNDKNETAKNGLMPE